MGNLAKVPRIALSSPSRVRGENNFRAFLSVPEKGQRVCMSEVALHILPFWTALFLIWTPCFAWTPCLYYSLIQYPSPFPSLSTLMTSQLGAFGASAKFFFLWRPKNP